MGVIYVPGDYSSIAAAIAAANSDDWIEITQNHDEEGIDIAKNFIGIRGSSKSIVWDSTSNSTRCYKR